MDFELTQKQRTLKDVAKKFCIREFDQDLAMELDRTEVFPMKLYRKAAKQGFSSLFIPEKYGGKGQGYLGSCLVMEEMCRADSSLGLACMIGTFGSDMLLLHGTEEQKARYLPPFCRGEAISAAAFTEPARGTWRRMDNKWGKNSDNKCSSCRLFHCIVPDRKHRQTSQKPIPVYSGQKNRRINSYKTVKQDGYSMRNNRTHLI